MHSIGEGVRKLLGVWFSLCRTDNVCLAIALFVASGLYSGLVTVAVEARGRGELGEGSWFW